MRGEKRPPTILFDDPPVHTRMRGLLTAAFTPRVIEEQRDAIRENAQEAQRQLLAEKQAAYAKVRSVSSMTQDLQTLERQLWSSMPASVKSMLDFSASSGARGS